MAAVQIARVLIPNRSSIFSLPQQLTKDLCKSDRGFAPEEHFVVPVAVLLIESVRSMLRRSKGNMLMLLVKRIDFYRD